MGQALRASLGRSWGAWLPWTPALLGGAFLVAFLARFPGLIARVYWDSDAASAATLTQAVGHGTIAFERYAYYAFLLLALATRWLPFHRELWEGGGYVLSLVSVALLAWTSWRVAGAWAGVMTATIGIATSPFVNYDRVTLNYHTPTWFAVAVLAAFCVWMTRAPEYGPAIGVTVAVALFAGISLGDELFAVVGLVPLLVTGGMLLVVATTRRARGCAACLITAGILALPCGWLTTRLARCAGLVVYPPVPLRFATGDALWRNLGKLLYGIVQLGNGNTFLGAPLDASSVLSLGCAGAMLAALAAPFVLLRRSRRTSPCART